MSNLTLDPQPLEAGYIKRNGTLALKLFVKNSGLFVVFASALTLINYFCKNYLLLTTNLLTFCIEVLFAISVCFLAEHKRSAFDFFTKNSLNFCKQLLLRTVIFRIYAAIILMVCASGWIVKFFISDNTVDVPATSEDGDSGLNLFTVVLVAFLIIVWTYIVGVLSLYILKFFIVLQYNLAPEFIESKIDVDDHPGLNRVVRYALLDIKVNRFATIQTGAIYGAFCFCSGLFLSTIIDTPLKDNLVSGIIEHLATILFVLYTYQLHREILLGKRKVKQEETESNIDSVPEAS